MGGEGGQAPKQLCTAGLARRHSHGVIGAVAGKGVPDVDAGAFQPVPAAVQAVPHHHGLHGAAPTQVHRPPRLWLPLGLRA